jgi:hypothetical protein
MFPSKPDIQDPELGGEGNNFFLESKPKSFENFIFWFF